MPGGDRGLVFILFVGAPVEADALITTIIRSEHAARVQVSVLDHNLPSSGRLTFQAWNKAFSDGTKKFGPFAQVDILSWFLSVSDAPVRIERLNYLTSCEMREKQMFRTRTARVSAYPIGYRYGQCE